MERPFRFIAPMPPLGADPRDWRDRVRRLEDLGYSALSISDHVTGGWAMDPLTMMTALAQASSHLRILSLVLANDFRHPLLLHRAASAIDRLSEGRLELGLGAGWSAADYRVLGLPFDRPAARIARLAETVALLKALWGGGPVQHLGPWYDVGDIEAQPLPVQRPHPPLLIGGGGRLILDLAAREADIVGIHASLDESSVTARVASDLSADRFAEKVEYVRQRAMAHGRDPDLIEFQVSIYLMRVGQRRSSAVGVGSLWARLLQADPALVRTSPAVLVGSLDTCVELLEERRARLGFSYVKISGDPIEAAPLVARLSGS